MSQPDHVGSRNDQFARPIRRLNYVAERLDHFVAVYACHHGVDPELDRKWRVVRDGKFRQTSINSGKRCALTRSKTAAQTAYPQVRHPSLKVRTVLRLLSSFTRLAWGASRRVPSSPQGVRRTSE